MIILLVSIVLMFFGIIYSPFLYKKDLRNYSMKRFLYSGISFGLGLGLLLIKIVKIN